jgi:hypothetical protein
LTSERQRGVSIRCRARSAENGIDGALLDAVAVAGVKVVQGNVGEISQDAMSVRCGG